MISRQTTLSEIKPGEVFTPRGLFVAIWIPLAILQLPDLNDGAKLLYGQLCRFANQKSECVASLDELANAMGSIVRTVSRHLDELVAAGLIRRRRGGKGNPTVCEFLWHPALAESLRRRIDRTNFVPDLQKVSNQDRTNFVPDLQKVSNQTPKVELLATQLQKMSSTTPSQLQKMSSTTPSQLQKMSFAYKEVLDITTQERTTLHTPEGAHGECDSLNSVRSAAPAANGNGAHSSEDLFGELMGLAMFYGIKPSEPQRIKTAHLWCERDPSEYPAILNLYQSKCVSASSVTYVPRPWNFLATQEWLGVGPGRLAPPPVRKSERDEAHARAEREFLAERKKS